MTKTQRLAAVLTLAFTSLAAAEDLRPAPKRIDVADGIYLFVTPSYGDVGLDGNSVVILSSDGVLVFDSNGTPAAAAAVLAEIRKLTKLPVRYLVYSHWHWDHWYGAEVYKQAFPDVRIISHEKTREMMLGPALAFNQPGLDRDLPGYIGSIEKKVAATEKANPDAPELPRLRHLLAEDRFFLEQKKSVHHTVADVTFEDRLNLYLGDRAIQLLHYDRAVTPGDAFLYLPREKIVVTGDLLVNPIPFALSCYPTGWLDSLEKIEALDASILVPGHGEPLHDKELLHAQAGVLRELLRQGRQAKDRGLSVDEAKATILPSLHDLMLKITHDDPALNDSFRVYLVDWYLHRVYDELAGPLTDAIAPIPES